MNFSKMLGVIHLQKSELLWADILGFQLMSLNPKKMEGLEKSQKMTATFASVQSLTSQTQIVPQLDAVLNDVYKVSFYAEIGIR